MRKVILWAVAGLLLLLILLPVGGWLYLRTSLPQTTGTVRLAGLTGPVEIVRDDAGVPHIFAETEADAFFALGYVHAQDRMWQMEMNRRVGAGRLSEVLGESTLEIDKFLRTLGTYRAAEAAWPALAPETQAVFQAYAAGVNAWIDQGHTLPPEFLILRFTPEPWQVADSLVWAKMMAWDLGGDYDMELLRTRLTQALGPERTAQILPVYPENGATILAAAGLHQDAGGFDGLLELDSTLQQSFNLRGLDVGSNNWVVSGDQTASGLPLLANDPHLGARIPSIWYLAQVQGGGYHVAGATLPGLPAFPAGHNGHIAWGVTNVGPDVQDLYVERINPADPNQYEVNGTWVEMEIVEELIYVDGEEEPLRWAARSTRHGPLISDVQETGAPVALRWTALDDGDTTVDAFLAINRATNWEEFLAAMDVYVAPSQNFVYADLAGNIGYFAPGRIPIRAQGDGLLPVPGWTDDYAWVGWIPQDELPQAFNPPVGYIVTANNKVVDDGYPYLIGNGWAPPYRADRITQLIQSTVAMGRLLSVEEMIAIQGDQVSEQALTLLPGLLRAQSLLDEPTPVLSRVDGRRARNAFALLADWQGESDRGSAATAIYQAWYIQMGNLLFADDLRGDLYDEMATRVHDLFIADVLEDPAGNAHWCDNVLSVPVESCAELTILALDAALDELAGRLGDDMAAWRWGALHHTQYPHTPFSEVNLLRRFFHRSIENGGDKYTVNVSPILLENPYDQHWVPSYRQIIDMADLNGSLFMHTTGQSGNLLSRHYDDLIEPHRDVEYLPMTWGRENVRGKSLRLEPR